MGFSFHMQYGPGNKTTTVPSLSGLEASEQKHIPLAAYHAQPLGCALRQSEGVSRVLCHGKCTLEHTEMLRGAWPALLPTAEGSSQHYWGQRAMVHHHRPESSKLIFGVHLHPPQCYT